MASLAGPEGASLVQEVDSDKEDDVDHDDGVSILWCVLTIYRKAVPVVQERACRVHCSGLLQRILSLLNRTLPSSS